MERLPDLPIGIQYFAEIRKGNSIYVDKTQYIYDMCRPPNRPYFLSRPRRFGKSLTTFANYWFETGTPTFLIKLMRKRFSYQLEETEVNSSILEFFTLEKFDELDVNSLLLQTGYLTIKEITPYGKFILNYPNKEVQQSFGQFLLSEYTQTPASDQR